MEIANRIPRRRWWRSKRQRRMRIWLALNKIPHCLANGGDFLYENNAERTKTKTKISKSNTIVLYLLLSPSNFQERTITRILTLTKEGEALYRQKVFLAGMTRGLGV